MYEKPDLYNADCMEAMKEFPDKFFDLAVVDPPYGSGNANDMGGGITDSAVGLTDTNRTLSRTGGTWAAKYAKKSLRGTLPRMESISKNFSVFHAIK